MVVSSRPVTKTIGGITFEVPFAWLQDDSSEVLDWQWARDAAAQQYLDGPPDS
jgi:prolyl oligopeptidase